MKRRKYIPRSPRAFTLVDLLVVIALVMLLGAYTIFAVHRSGHGENRVRCASNLKQIGMALQTYAEANAGNYPRTLYNPDDPTIRAYTGVPAHDPFAADGPQANDVTAAMYLLLRTEDITSGVFICPSTTNRTVWNYGGRNNTARDRSNFPSDQYLSYSIADPYPSSATVRDGYLWNNTRNSNFAMAGDMNPGTPELMTLTPTSTARAMQAGNSLNHQRVGQNILYGDGHVSFEQNAFQGAQQDNIYGPGRMLYPGTRDERIDPVARGNLNSSPGHKEDSVLLPVATSNPGPTDFQIFVRSGELSTLAGWASVCLAAIWAGIRWGWPASVAAYHRMQKLTPAERRLRRGLCPKCGYDLRASPERCPECGEPRRVCAAAHGQS